VCARGKREGVSDDCATQGEPRREMGTRANAYMHAHTHTRARAHTHTQTYTTSHTLSLARARARALSLSCSRPLAISPSLAFALTHSPSLSFSLTWLVDRGVSYKAHGGLACGDDVIAVRERELIGEGGLVVPCIHYCSTWG
jgi:hypothetical protein